MFSLVLVPHYLAHCCSTVSSETGKCESSYSSLLFQGCLVSSGSLEIPYKLWNQLVNLYKEVIWGFDRDCVESVDQFREFHHLKNITGVGAPGWLVV